MKSYNLSRLDSRAEFGTTKSVMNPNTGANIPTFVAQFTVYCGDVSTSINQSISLLGTDSTQTRMIAVRHNPSINYKQLVHLDNTEYTIVNISSDNSSLNSFDVVTLQYSKGLKA